MTISIVTFRFQYTCECPNLSAACVCWGMEDISAETSSFPNIVDLVQKDGLHDFEADTTITAEQEKKVFFMFSSTFQDGSTCNSDPQNYTITHSKPDPILISDAYRGGTNKTMTLRFKINYHTFYGQNLCIVGSLPELGCWDLRKGLKLTHSGSHSKSIANGLFSDSGYNWQMDLVLPQVPVTFSYKYAVVNDGTDPFLEPGGPRVLAFDSEMNSTFFEFDDVWRWNEFAQSLFAKRLFDETLFIRKQVGIPKIFSNTSQGNVCCVFCAHCAAVGRARSLFVVGSIPALGQWNPAKGTELKPTADLQWSTCVIIPKEHFPFEFKFVAVGGASSVVWETHENRNATISNWQPSDCGSVVTIDSWHLSFANLSFHGAGVFVDLNQCSIFNETGQPVGFDFSVVAKIADWSAKVGLAAIHFIGLLDTTAMFQANHSELPVSGFALNPIFVDLSTLLVKTELTSYDSDMLSVKLAALRSVWSQNRQRFEVRVQNFRKDNKFWLEDYEKLCYGRGAKLEDPVDPEFALFVDFVQYICFQQLAMNIAYARDQNIAVGIDITFALSEQSVEAFAQPDLFLKDYYLGTPPTPTNPIGKILPAYPYNFQNATEWFRKRVAHFGNIFPIVRLESTIQFFRQWIVPRETSIRAVFGHFEPSVNISYAELETSGIWELERYTQPYIKPTHLIQLFGPDAQLVQNVFFEYRSDGSIQFRQQFSNEKALMESKLNPHDAALREKYKYQLLRLIGEVLLIKAGDNEYRPRPQLALAATENGNEKSYSFTDLPMYHQNTFVRLDEEFWASKQKCIWSFNGRSILQKLTNTTDAIILSDAAGSDGEVCDEVLQAVGVLPLRVQMEGRTPNAEFDDIRSYPYLSVASPQRDLSIPMRYMWENGQIASRRLWEEEFWESGQPPEQYTDEVAKNIMKQHCWSGSMWVMFPIDSLYGASNHIKQIEGSRFGILDLDEFFIDKAASEQIASILELTKRK